MLASTDGFMTDQKAATIDNTDNNLSKATDQFINGSQKDQLQLIPQLISMGEPGWEILMSFLQTSEVNTPDIVQGKVYRALYQVKTSKTEQFIQTHFPNGIIALNSQRNIDYRSLNQLLLEQKFQDADTLTRHLLCELAGPGALQRKWVYFY